MQADEIKVFKFVSYKCFFYSRIGVEKEEEVNLNSNFLTVDHVSTDQTVILSFSQPFRCTACYYINTTQTRIFICIFIVTSFALCITSDAENEWADMWFSIQQNYPLEEATKQFSLLEDRDVITQCKYKLF